MGIELLKLVLVGAIVAMPPGPVLVLVLQKTLRNGRWSGFCTGLGAMCADALYATLGLYTLGLVQGFIDRYEPQIMLAGGLIISIVGASMAFGSRQIKTPGERTTGGLSKAGYGVQAFGCALSNPGAIAIMMGLLAVFSLDARSLSCPVWLAILFVALGEAIYWFVLTWILSRSVNLGEKGLGRISKWGGIILIIIGLLMAVRGLVMLF